MSHSRSQQTERLEDRLGTRIAARLSDTTETVPHDIGERLRHARMQALAQRKRPRIATADVVLPSGNSATLGGLGRDPNRLQRMVMVLSVLALFIGLVAIDRTMDEKAAQEVAKMDAALLIDDLPPAAYTDPGFLQFLRLNRDESR